MRKPSWQYRYSVTGRTIVSLMRTDSLETAKKMANKWSRMLPSIGYEVWDYVNGNGVRVYSVKGAARALLAKVDKGKTS